MPKTKMIVVDRNDKPIKGTGDFAMENQALKNELEALRSQLKSEQQRIETLQPETLAPEEDDRNDLVEVTYGMGGNLQTYKMPKKDAVEALVRFYSPLEVQIIPRRLGNKFVNDAPCYVRSRGRNIDGDPLDFYKDMQLSVVADRIIDHPKWNIELVPKQEYEVYEAKRVAKETEWQQPINRSRIEKAVNTLANLS